MISEIVGRGADQSVLFATIDRRAAAAEIIAAAQTDFDEYEFAAVRHHKIDFPASCSIISSNEAQAASHEESLRSAFSAAAEFRCTGS